VATQTEGKLNWLLRALPEGLVVDAQWLARHGFSTSLRSHYVAAGWLEQPARRVYRRPAGPLAWQHVVVSLQTLLRQVATVGARTALELQGYAHYISQKQMEIQLYGPGPLPGWVKLLPLPERFIHHNSATLFGDESSGLVLPELGENTETLSLGDGLEAAGLRVLPWGTWNWPLTVSTPERAVLELLSELPARESFHHVDVLMEGLGGLSPRRLQRLLVGCRSVKVKRLFFFFADRHQHAWLKRLDRATVDLGRGHRMIVRGGRFDAVYQITVPEDLDGVQ